MSAKDFLPVCPITPRLAWDVPGHSDRVRHASPNVLQCPAPGAAPWPAPVFPRGVRLRRGGEEAHGPRAGAARDVSFHGPGSVGRRAVHHCVHPPEASARPLGARQELVPAGPVVNAEVPAPASCRRPVRHRLAAVAVVPPTTIRPPPGDRHLLPAAGSCVQTPRPALPWQDPALPGAGSSPLPSSAARVSRPGRLAGAGALRRLGGQAGVPYDPPGLRDAVCRARRSPHVVVGPRRGGSAARAARHALDLLKPGLWRPPALGKVPGGAPVPPSPRCPARNDTRSGHCMMESAVCWTLSSFMHTMLAAAIPLITLGPFSFLYASQGSSGVVVAMACVGRRDQNVFWPDKIGLMNLCALLYIDVKFSN